MLPPGGWRPQCSFRPNQTKLLKDHFRVVGEGWQPLHQLGLLTQQHDHKALSDQSVKANCVQAMAWMERRSEKNDPGTPLQQSPQRQLRSELAVFKLFFVGRGSGYSALGVWETQEAERKRRNRGTNRTIIVFRSSLRSRSRHRLQSDTDLPTESTSHT